jgi:hypothetical protein
MNLRGWFRQVWQPEARRIVLEQYRAIGKLALADIALRGSVFNGFEPGLSLFDAGVAEGRRQMALEIIRICDGDVRALFGTIERALVEGEDDGGQSRRGRR